MAARNRDRRTREAVKASPERLGVKRAYEREWYRRNKGVDPSRWRVGVTPSVSTVTLSAGPFVAFFEMVMARDEISLTELAARWGMSDRTLRVIRNSERSPSIETVERALIADGTVDLDDLYPNLFAEAAA